MNNLWSIITFAVILLLASGVLIWRHLQARREINADELDEREVDYLRRQFRRRMQTSAMMAVVGVALLIGIWINALNSPLVAILYWLAVVLVVCWIALLAFADLISTRMYYRQEKNIHDREYAKLTADLKRLRRETKVESNGDDENANE